MGKLIEGWVFDCPVNGCEWYTSVAKDFYFEDPIVAGTRDYEQHWFEDHADVPPPAITSTSSH